ncbi:unnamed protein product [Linum tenue]|uniref:F-box/LRR-repeat protein 15-like leucin rich repeat domain-containing protein n=1 Tax=Linum tenue TaxID=586396 RepID=A0AAV0KNG5_9ROSI|nr:unnamed protein product [Linum tenue]
MGGSCSRKRGALEREDNKSPAGRLCRKFSKNGSSKWLVTSVPKLGGNDSQGQKNSSRCPPPLLDLCIQNICEDIDNHGTFYMLPRDISQEIFNELVYSLRLTDVSLEAFRDCALQDIHLVDYPGVNDYWMDVISSQGMSLLSLDVSGSNVTDSGFSYLRVCKNLESLGLDYCERLSDLGLKEIGEGFSNLTSLSFRRNNAITAEGMRAVSGLKNLVKLDMERCPGVGGGFAHLNGLSKLESLNINWCNCITDDDLKHLSAGLRIWGSITLPFLTWRVAQSQQHVWNFSQAQLASLSYLNLNRCHLSDAGCQKFSKFAKLKILNLGFNDITDACLVHLKGLTALESLNLDSCQINDDGMENLKGLKNLKCLVLSDTEVGSKGLRHLTGLHNLESINLSFTMVTDCGLRELSGLTSIKSLNLDARQITDTGLAALTSLTGLTHLDLFGARITDSGTSYLKNFKNLCSLEICGGGLTDAGVKNIKELSSLSLLNLSQNCNLTDRSLELISGLTGLISLNVSNSRITAAGLRHLKPLKSLKSLSMESCKVTASDIEKLRSFDLPNLVSFRPEE